ncbi:unnamed protein product [Darwinula stevensoni]|uniref:F-box domain-containing protein n=1 Tax=Darwinula stevensoni TaxID=69355 RepID=A0A7R8X6U5_9CRUS|nr:unnamed protein product [Darwinula stevensoni]CAG0881634.1 unnamed protein product [Darwinula stevensoni]
MDRFTQSEPNIVSGSSSDPFSALPPELFEMILCRLPITDLCLHLPLVSSYWHSVIASDAFIPWKKLYYKYKLGTCPEAKKKVQTLASSLGMTSVEHCLLAVLRFALQYKGHHHQDVVIWLKSWSKIRLCVRLLEESIPEGASSIWTVLVALSILSNEVDDIIYIFHLISHSPGNRITAYDLIDFFYSLALLFQHAQYTFDVNHGFHGLDSPSMQIAIEDRAWPPPYASLPRSSEENAVVPERGRVGTRDTSRRDRCLEPGSPGLTSAERSPVRGRREGGRRDEGGGRKGGTRDEREFDVRFRSVHERTKES